MHVIVKRKRKKKYEAKETIPCGLFELQTCASSAKDASSKLIKFKQKVRNPTLKQKLQKL